MLLAALPGDGASTAPPTAGGRPTWRASDPDRSNPTDAGADAESDGHRRPPAPTEEPTAGRRAGEVADLCETFFDLPCGLGAGRYAPSRFSPAFDIELGDGWSNAAHAADLVALTRAQGADDVRRRIAEVYPER